MISADDALQRGVENSASGSAWDPAGYGVIPRVEVTSFGDPMRDRLWGGGYALGLHGYRRSSVPDAYADHMRNRDFAAGFEHGQSVAAKHREVLEAFDQGFNAEPYDSDRGDIRDRALYLPRSS